MTQYPQIPALDWAEDILFNRQMSMQEETPDHPVAECDDFLIVPIGIL
jgi:hypothetical protein